MRYRKLDAIRGVAIIWMIAFHANYLLVNIFKNSTLDFSGIFWFLLWKAVVLSFILVSGISLFLFSQNKATREICVFSLKRAILLGIIAIVISFITFTFFWENRIVFGIIHFFTFSFLLSSFFIRFWAKNILIWWLIAAVGIFFNSIRMDNNYLFMLGLKNPFFFSADYYPIFPWFGFFLIWYGIAHILHRKDRLEGFLRWEIIGGKILSALGRNSLVIYLIHVPVLYAIFSLVFSR